jgi:hypothetical protein
MNSSTIINLLIGLALLLLGRKLFWLFVAVAGFVLGLVIAPLFLSGQPDWVVLLVAIGAGILGALLAVLVQEIAVAVAGFIFGGYALLSVLELASLNPGEWGWIVFIIGGIIGAALVLYLFDPALIVLSSLAGASLVSQALTLDPPVDLVVLVVLAAVGIAVQSGLLRREPPERRRSLRRRSS